jgi:hypothetical protein
VVRTGRSADEVCDEAQRHAAVKNNVDDNVSVRFSTLYEAYFVKESSLCSALHTPEALLMQRITSKRSDGQKGKKKNQVPAWYTHSFTFRYDRYIIRAFAISYGMQV